MRAEISEREFAARYPTRGNFRWLLRLGGHTKRKERSAKSKDRDFFLHVFFSVSLDLSLDT